MVDWGPLRLIRLVVKKVSDNELFMRSAALSFYFTLAIFPMLLFLISIVGPFAGPGSQLRATILSSVGRLAPGSASALIHQVVNKTLASSSVLKAAVGMGGALWAGAGFRRHDRDGGDR